MSAPTTSVEMGSAEPYVDMESTKQPPNEMAPAAAAYTGMVPVRTNNMAIVSMVCGIVSLAWGGIILGPMAIFFGIYAIKEIDERPGEYEGRPMAQVGIICGVIALVLYVVFLIIILSTMI